MDEKPIDLKPLSDLGIHLLDKLDKACGWIAQPKGKRKDFEEAYEYYKQSIIEDKSKPEIVKAAEIANVRKILKEYLNQYDIVNIALDNLDGKNGLGEIDEDWLSYFMDNAKLVNNEHLKIIWGKILANEVVFANENKKILHILSTISQREANAFSDVCNYYVTLKNVNGMGGMIQIFENTTIGVENLLRLNAIGLIDYIPYGIEEFQTVLRFDENEERTIEIIYFDEEIHIDIPDGKLNLGKVKLTPEGEILRKIIIPQKVERLLDNIQEQYRKKSNQ